MTEENAAPAKKETQRSLIPMEPPKGKFQEIPLEELRRLRLVGPEPTKDFIETVKLFGVVMPIFLCKPESGPWKVGDGTRRIKAALIADKKIIPAMVYKDDQDMRRAMTLMLNKQRSANPLGEVKAIMELQQRRFSPQQISDATGMDLSTINKRLRLASLNTELYTATLAGHIKVSVAESACKLPVTYQEKLLKVFTKQGRLTMKDVGHIKDARKRTAVAKLPPSIFENEKPQGDLADLIELANAFVVERHRERYAGNANHNPERCMTCSGSVIDVDTHLMAAFAKRLLDKVTERPATEAAKHCLYCEATENLTVVGEKKYVCEQHLSRYREELSAEHPTVELSRAPEDCA